MTSQDRATEFAARAFHGSWRWLARTRSDGVLSEHDGVLVAATGLPDPTLNPSYVVAEPADPHAALRWSVDARAHLPVPATGVDVPDGGWPRVESALRDLGYVERVRRPAMAVAVDEVSREPARGLTLRPVTGEQDWSAYVDVQNDVFNIRHDVAREFPPYGSLSDPRVELIVGSVDGEVVATAAVFVVDDVAGLYAIATRPEHRRRGFGAAITSYAVEAAAARGARHVALQATPDGYPLYRRLGFADIGEWVVYVDPAVEG